MNELFSDGYAVTKRRSDYLQKELTKLLQNKNFFSDYVK